MWVFDRATLAFLEVNEAAVATYGYSREEFAAMTIADIRPPEDVSTLLAHMGESRGPRRDSGHWRHRLRDGTIIDVEVISHLLQYEGRAAALVVAQDVTARLRAEAALAESEARKGAILDASLDAVVAIDAQGRIIEFNAAAEAMFGHSQADVRGRDIGDTIVPPSLRARHRGGMERYLAGGEPVILGRHVELTGMRADGREFPIELSINRVRGAEPATFTAFIRDLSETRRLEEQFIQAQKMEGLGRLAGGIAHDFNNLLTAILGYTDLALSDPGVPEAAREDLGQIAAAASRAAELTSQLLAFSRRQVLQPIALHLGELLDEVAPFLRRLLGEDVQVLTRVDPELGHVLADSGRLTQVLVNLAVNARDAMPDGGTLTLEARNVELDADYAEGHVEVTPGPYVQVAVSDTGIGMDEATRTRLFEPFFTTKERGKGTGLGLSTVYGIVRQSGGHIWVYSEPGRGAVFKLYLPRVAPTGVSRASPPARQADRGGHETILVVEDDEAVRRLVETVLAKRGYRVLAAGTPIEGIALAQAHDGRIDLLLTDVVMPDMNGVELARRVQEVVPGVRVLFVSGYTENTIEHHGVLDPGVSFLPKPFSPDALTERIRMELDRARDPGRPRPEP